MEQERRKFPRISVLADIVYKKVQPLTPENQLSLTKNIGQGGICFISYDKLNIADILELTINLSDEAPVHAIGRVVWIENFKIGEDDDKKFDVGLEFINISAKDQAIIGKYVFTRGHF